jgi:hypothetical protein
MTEKAEDLTATFAVLCSWCKCDRGSDGSALRFVPKRWTTEEHFCSDAHRKAANRAGRYPSEGEDRVHLYRPSSLHFARRWLDVGGSLDHLVLRREERDLVLIAHAHRFSFGLRWQAFARLAGRYAAIGSDLPIPDAPTLQLGPLQRFLSLTEVVEAAWQETNVVGNWRHNEFGMAERRPGRPRRVAPYIPAETPWPLLFRDFIPRELERRARKLRRKAGASLTPNLLQEDVGLVAEGGVYVESRLSSKRRGAAFRGHSGAEYAEAMGWRVPTHNGIHLAMLEAIRAELLGRKPRYGEPLEYVPHQRPAFPEPHFDAEGEIDPRTPEYWAVRSDKHGEEEKVNAIEIKRQLDRIETKLDRIEDEQHRQAREQLAREAQEYLEEIED